MCLIISSEKGNLVDLADLEIAYNNNPDGAGIMIFTGDRVIQHHVVSKDFGDIRALALEGVGHPHAIHLRYCTRGKVNTDNCHPFTVLSKDDGDEHDLTLMHNGTMSWITISKEDAEKGHSDTSVFALRIQKNLRSNEKINLEHLHNEEIVSKFSKRVSSWNKVVFLDSKGRFSYFNKSSGIIRNDMWYSNDYSLKVGYRDAQVAHHGPKVYSGGTTTGYKSYHYVNGVKTETTTETFSNYAATLQKDIKPGKKQVTFTRSNVESDYVYMREDSKDVTNFSLVDPEKMCKVKCGSRLGKRERKMLTRWLESEASLNKLKEERRLERKASTDSKGRKTYSVGTPTKTESTVTLITPETVSSKNDNDTHMDHGVPNLYGYGYGFEDFS